MSSDNTPNFDNMTPEEMMAWMESLAKRQGANEGFTTDADVDVPEIDPNSVVIDEPGYVPYGQEEAPRAARPSPPPPSPVAPPVIRTPVPPPPISEPEPEPAEAELGSTMGENALAWLESLAADQGASSFDLDLSSLEPEPAHASDERDIDPMAWLQGIASEPELPEPKPRAQERSEEPLGGVDPMAWLESLARRQGVPEEELTTSADIDVPMPDEDEFELEPFASIEDDEAEDEESEPLILENPAAWLDSLAVAGGFEDEAVRAEPSSRMEAESEDEMEVDLSIDAIEQAIREGVVTADQIRFYQEYQMERAALRDDVQDYDDDEDGAAEAMDMPEWLAEMKAEAEAEEEEIPAERPPLESLFAAPPAPTEDFPDWLAEDAAEGETVDSIFADDEADEIEVDYDDPWVEAFDEEYERGGTDVEAVPDWYLQNTSDPDRMAAVESVIEPEETVIPLPSMEPVAQVVTPPAPVPMTVIAPVQLVYSELPSETNLPAGERQALPAWMNVTATQAAVAVTVPAPVEEEAQAEEAPQFSGTPDWLRETDEQPAAQVPDWLSQAEAEPEEETLFSPPVAAVPPPVAPIVETPAPPAPSSASGTLEEARSRYQSGDMNASLAIYEGLVRTSQALEDVASDLTSMARDQKNNPVVYRVLGDSLMRQGRLQDALNTYREALNWL
ncbi:MAG: hypothetical protein IT320_24960 [Anaerolineae bacterium]|nr:hypothetical protein [Anaerolineae bacterium]